MLSSKTRAVMLAATALGLPLGVLATTTACWYALHPTKPTGAVVDGQVCRYVPATAYGCLAVTPDNPDGQRTCNYQAINPARNLPLYTVPPGANQGDPCVMVQPERDLPVPQQDAVLSGKKCTYVSESPVPTPTPGN